MPCWGKPINVVLETMNSSSERGKCTYLQLFIRVRKMYLLTATEAELLTATLCLLTFTNQKNGVRSEKIEHKVSGHPIMFPVQYIARQIIHIRRTGMEPQTPLHWHYRNPEPANPNLWSVTNVANTKICHHACDTICSYGTHRAWQLQSSRRSQPPFLYPRRFHSPRLCRPL